MHTVKDKEEEDNENKEDKGKEEEEEKKNEDKEEEEEECPFLCEIQGVQWTSCHLPAAASYSVRVCLEDSSHCLAFVFLRSVSSSFAVRDGS